MTGRARRRLYKPERKPARTKGVLALYDCAPVMLPNASVSEVKSALFALCRDGGFIIGRALDYDPLKDEYTVIAKSLRTGKVQDVEVKGVMVADVIRVARRLNGGRHQSTFGANLEAMKRTRVTERVPLLLPGVSGSRA